MPKVQIQPHRPVYPTPAALITCADSDVANVYVVLSSRALNPNLFIIARASEIDSEKKLKMAGADRVISPYYIFGKRVASIALQPVASDFFDMVMHEGEQRGIVTGDDINEEKIIHMASGLG